MLLLILACDDQNQSPQTGGNQGGTTAAIQAGTLAGTQGGTPAGSQGGTPAGNQGGTPAGNQGGTPAGNQGGTLAGNQGGNQGGIPAGMLPMDVRNLTIAPTIAVLSYTDPNLPPPTQNFILTIEKTDGSSEVLPSDRAMWTVDPASFGEITQPGVFSSFGQYGTARIKASYGNLNAVAEVYVQKPEDILLNGLTDEITTQFDQAERVENCQQIQFVYPEPMTVIPLNLSGLSLQWNGVGSGTYMVEAKFENNQIRWFTTENQVTPAGLAWESLKRASLGNAIDLKVSVLQNGQSCTSPSIPLIVDRSELIGAVYYWSTADSGIMRLAVGETQPEAFLTQATAPTIFCPACHALSRDGSRVAFTKTTFPPMGFLATSLVRNPADLLYDPTNNEGYFPSFSPDPRKLVAGSSGKLVIKNSDTGVLELELPMLPNKVGGEPDWSWQGDKIVAVLGAQGLVNFLPNNGINQGGLYQWTFANDQWQGPTLIYDMQNGVQNNRPAYSPDGSMIAFNTQGENPNTASGSNQGQATSNPSTDLWITYPDGSGAVRLNRANQASGLGNNWPKWSPTDRRGRMWLAFSSLRNYGNVLINTESRPQIWVTAIDPNAPAGQDPSAPAFWLPYQSVSSGNHIPYWAAYEKR